MKASELIAALQALPGDPEVIMPDIITMDPPARYSEIYASAMHVEVRYVSQFELDHMTWDFSVFKEQKDGRAPVVLLTSSMCAEGEDQPEGPRRYSR